MTTQAEIRDWCDQQNSQDGPFARSVWYFTIPDSNGGHISARLDGLDAEEVRAAARGRFPDYAGWTPDKMRQHIGLVKYRLQMGMSEDSFRSIAARWPRETPQNQRQSDFGQQFERAEA